jgi:hypothetical protein
LTNPEAALTPPVTYRSRKPETVSKPGDRDEPQSPCHTRRAHHAARTRSWKRLEAFNFLEDTRANTITKTIKYILSVCAVLLSAASAKLLMPPKTSLHSWGSGSSPADHDHDGTFEFTNAKSMTRQVQNKTYHSVLQLVKNGTYETSYGEAKSETIFEIVDGTLRVQQRHTKVQYKQGLPPFRVGTGTRVK